MLADTVQSNCSESSCKDFRIFLSLENLLTVTGHLLNTDKQLT